MSGCRATLCVVTRHPSQLPQPAPPRPTNASMSSMNRSAQLADVTDTSSLELSGVMSGRMRLSGLFAGRRNIVRPRARQDVLGVRDFVGRIAMHGQQDATVLDPALVPFGFIFWNPHPDQRTDQSTDRPAHAETRERTHDRPG